MDCATRGGRRRWLRIRRSAQCAALTRLVYVGALSTTGCTLSPSVNILGSFFPAWLICIVTGLVLALIVWRVLVVTAIDVAMPSAKIGQSQPVICRSGRMVMPGLSMSRMK
jgi:hypothetical protein